MTAPDSRSGLGDDAARHTIDHRLDSTLFVEAGAGSGKTTGLVSRIVRLLASGSCSFDSFAAVTFTEAAALELRVRVRESLVALADGGGDGLERDRARAALDHLDEAAISTIHGFCQRLLAEHPIEAGLPPRIEILDEVRQSLDWANHWSALLDRLGLDAGMRRLFGAALLVGVTPAHVELLAKEVSEEWDRCGRAGPDTTAVLAGVERAVLQAAERVESSIGRALELEPCCTDPGDRLLTRLREARALRADLLSATAPAAATGAGAPAAGTDAAGTDGDVGAPTACGGVTEDLLAVLAAKDPNLWAGTIGQKGCWTCDIDQVRGFLNGAQDARDAVIGDVSDAVLRALVATFDVAAREAAEARRADGKLVFHDLLVLARDLLVENAAVLAELRRKLRFLLIDEFQDTDPLQIEIAELIGGGQRSDTDTGGIDAGRLFFVGDPKQSIYRFRGADLDAYVSARGRLANAGPLSLTSNFRSVPGILEFVNECFASLMGDGYSALQSVRPAASPAPSVWLVGGPLDPALKRHDQRVSESEACATVIERAARADPWSVADGAGGLRPARLNDIAILVPRRTGLVELEAALDTRGIAYRVESASLVYRTQEVRDLLALCKAVDDPSDRVALLAVLRSPAFACRDGELFAFRTAGGTWSIEGPGQPPAGGDTATAQAGECGAQDGECGGQAGECGGQAGDPADVDGAATSRAVSRALQVIRGYRDQRFELGPVGVLEMAVRDRRLLQLAAGSPRARESWRRARFLIERARAFVDGGGGGLREFASFVGEQLSEGLRSVESVLPEPDEDVVHILTVHAAKGLEFPITLLAGFGTTDEARKGPGRRVLRTPAGEVEVHLNSRLKTAGFAGLKSAEDELEREEAVRLLYVAATRASDHLVVCAHHVPSTGEGTLGQRLYQAALVALEHRPGLWETIEVGEDAGGLPVRAAAAGPTDVGHGESAQGQLFDISTVRPAATAIIAQDIAPAASPPDWRAWRDERDKLLARIGRRRRVRATELAGLAALAGMSGSLGGEGAAKAPRLAAGAAGGAGSLGSLGAAGLAPEGDGSAPRRRGRGATRLGRAVHATLQAISRESARQVAAGLPAAPELRLLAEAEAKSECIGDRAGDVERLARSALSSPTVQAAFATGSPHREVYVATIVGDVVLDGYVDLCFEDDGGLTVVDYKTDSVRDHADAEASAERYFLQAAAYALALENATGLGVRRCVLVFLSPHGPPIELDVPDLAAAVEGVRSLLEGAA